MARKTKIDDRERVMKFGTAVCHPLRVTLLLAHANDGPASAKILSEEGLDTLGNVSYHQRKLVSLGALKLVHTRQGKGAYEKHYDLTEFGTEVIRTARRIGKNR
jgi:hypothetical protein